MDELISHLSSYSLQDFLMFSRETYLLILQDFAEQYAFLPLLQIVLTLLSLWLIIIRSSRLQVVLITLTSWTYMHLCAFYLLSYSAIFSQTNFYTTLLSIQWVALMFVWPFLSRKSALETQKAGAFQPKQLANQVLFGSTLYAIALGIIWGQSGIGILGSISHPIPNLLLFICLSRVVAPSKYFALSACALVVFVLELITFYLLGDQLWAILLFVLGSLFLLQQHFVLFKSVKP